MNLLRPYLRDALADMTESDFAEYIGTSQRQINRWLNEAEYVLPNMADKILTALGREDAWFSDEELNALYVNPVIWMDKEEAERYYNRKKNAEYKKRKRQKSAPVDKVLA